MPNSEASNMSEFDSLLIGKPCAQCLMVLSEVNCLPCAIYKGKKWYTFLGGGTNWHGHRFFISQNPKLHEEFFTHDKNSGRSCVTYFNRVSACKGVK